ncbi:hypothetical protein EGT74_24420 [Chitinophaga lutea]|uniref:Uncharacterized protein n=1 Tax=Chitinophaga lutea TaxID=2488634 RepID=A0A3N4PA59_9BACT|nr:hypothetical protein EGT74_24420 [Chitinophaga lutea]
MITKVECIVIECNVCNDIYEDGNGFSVFPDNNSAHPEDNGWHVDEDVHYCPGCHEIDEDDNLIVKPSAAPATDTGEQ